MTLFVLSFCSFVASPGPRRVSGDPRQRNPLFVQGGASRTPDTSCHHLGKFTLRAAQSRGSNTLCTPATSSAAFRLPQAPVYSTKVQTMQLTSAASRCGSSAAARHSLAAAPRPCAVAALPPTASSRARGAFIVIEGLDRAGKSTQVANLQSALEAEGVRGLDRWSSMERPVASTAECVFCHPLIAPDLPLLPALQLRCKTTRSPDRDTVIGGLLSAALKGQTTLPPQAMHLLFAANRWEKL